jgi:NAD(P)H-dependent flavin oxidoreductase YrpB (nitropropane dioxygenase family)
MKGGIAVGSGGVTLETFPDYAKLFGWALALGHARSGDPATIAGYCGQSKELDKALYEFAKAYSKQNQADYAVFCEAVKSGKLKVAKKNTL